MGHHVITEMMIGYHNEQIKLVCMTRTMIDHHDEEEKGRK